MGSPCELLTEAATAAEARGLADIVAAEAWRIEDKFSRYLSGNIVDRINSAAGKPIDVDEETSRLLDFAEELHQMSYGGFDVTSGVLRKVWTFDGSDQLPSKREVAELLDQIGWQKVSWRSPRLRLPPGMEIDLGGIGKEYAVDRSVQLLREASDTPCLVNFGGDLAVTGVPGRRLIWLVGIESIDGCSAAPRVQLKQGALATSGNARRFLMKDGRRYSHVLDPRTGWPVVQAASSITVAATTCTQAGMLSTLAMLRGPLAEQFLDKQAEKYWCMR